MRDVVADETLDGGEGVAELCGRRRLVGLEQRAEQSAVELGVKDRDAVHAWGAAKERGTNRQVGLPRLGPRRPRALREFAPAVRERVWGQLAQPDRACGVTPFEVSTGVTLCEPPLAT